MLKCILNAQSMGILSGITTYNPQRKYQQTYAVKQANTCINRPFTDCRLSHLWKQDLPLHRPNITPTKAKHQVSQPFVNTVTQTLSRVCLDLKIVWAFLKYRFSSDWNPFFFRPTLYISEKSQDNFENLYCKICHIVPNCMK